MSEPWLREIDLLSAMEVASQNLRRKYFLFSGKTCRTFANACRR